MSNERLKKFQELKKQRQKAENETRKDLYKEHELNKTNIKLIKKLENKQTEAGIELLKLNNPEKIDQVEKKKLWNYSIEDNERWESLQKAKKNNNVNENTIAENTYLKKINKINKQRKILGIEKGELKNGKLLILNDLKNDEKNKITKINKTKLKNGKDSNLFINQKNKDFNEKLSRYYDEYTKS